MANVSSELGHIKHVQKKSITIKHKKNLLLLKMCTFCVVICFGFFILMIRKGLLQSYYPIAMKWSWRIWVHQCRVGMVLWMCCNHINLLLICNSFSVDYILVNLDNGLHFLSFLSSSAGQVFDSLPRERQRSTPHSQYHGCWWSGDTGSQDIWSHAIDLIITEYSSVNTNRVKHMYSIQIDYNDVGLL